jgi:hypothetical protein
LSLTGLASAAKPMKCAPGFCTCKNACIVCDVGKSGKWCPKK